MEMKESNFIDKWWALIHDQFNRGERKDWYEKELELCVNEASRCTGTVLEISINLITTTVHTAP